MSAPMKLLRAMNGIHEEDVVMAGNTFYQTSKSQHSSKRILTLALAAALILTLGIAAAAAGSVIFGWGKNVEIRETRTDGGVKTTIYVHTGNLTEPVCVEDDRLFFIVNDEHVDITDQISETKAFIYQFTDTEGVVHYWIVGKNGPELWHYGYAEYLQPPGGDWMGGYVARTNNNTAPWLDSAREEIGFPAAG